jgi:hypothetical protein
MSLSHQRLSSVAGNSCNKADYCGLSKLAASEQRRSSHNSVGAALGHRRGAFLLHPPRLHACSTATVTLMALVAIVSIQDWSAAICLAVLSVTLPNH